MIGLSCNCKKIRRKPAPKKPDENKDKQDK